MAETIVQKHAANFETLKRAFSNGDVALMECRERKSGKKVAVICAVAFDGQEYHFTPFAALPNSNPYNIWDPPNPAGGF